MKKMMLALIALSAIFAGSVDAKRCGTTKCQEVETECEPPKCYQWRKVSVCPLKRVVYECPEGSNYGDTTCSEHEMVHGGASAGL
jgi:hypothetical protein